MSNCPHGSALCSVPHDASRYGIASPRCARCCGVAHNPLARMREIGVNMNWLNDVVGHEGREGPDPLAVQLLRQTACWMAELADLLEADTKLLSMPQDRVQHLRREINENPLGYVRDATQKMEQADLTELVNDIGEGADE